MEENRLGWYVKQSVETIIKVEERYRTVIIDKEVDSKTLRKEIYKEKENNWKGIEGRACMDCF